MKSKLLLLFLSLFAFVGGVKAETASLTKTTNKNINTTNTNVTFSITNLGSWKNAGGLIGDRHCDGYEVKENTNAVVTWDVSDDYEIVITKVKFTGCSAAGSTAKRNVDLLTSKSENQVVASVQCEGGNWNAYTMETESTEYLGRLGSNGSITFKHSDKKMYINSLEITYNLIKKVNVVFKDRNNVVTTIKGVPGDSFITPANLADITGYRFDGWDGLPDDNNIPASDCVVTARWTAKEYTITLNPDGGLDTELPVTYDGDYVLPTDLTRDGYTFDGWYLGETKWENNGTYTTAEDVTLLAKWTPNKYYITFDTNGGNTVNPMEVTYHALYHLLTTLGHSNPAYEFAGWYDENDKQWDNEGTYTTASNVTLKAKWKVTVNLKCNAGKFGTFVAPFDVKIPGGLKAWTVSEVEASGHIVLDPVTGTIPAKTPVILENTEKGAETVNKNFKDFDQSEGAESVEGLNNLTGVYKATTITSGYVMQTIDGKQKFYKVNADDPITVPANRCYMNQDSYVKGFYFNADDATAIGAVEALTSEDVKIFDINGRKLNSLQKGINIVNGKKIMVK